MTTQSPTANTAKTPAPFQGDTPSTATAGGDAAEATTGFVAEGADVLAIALSPGLGGATGVGTPDIGASASTGFAGDGPPWLGVSAPLEAMLLLGAVVGNA